MNVPKLTGFLVAAGLGSASVAGAGCDHQVQADGMPRQDVVATAMAERSFETLMDALTRAGLVDVVKGEGPFTVFAPAHAASAEMQKCEVEAPPADRQKLTSVMTYHVVDGRITAAQVTPLDSAKPVQGQSLAVDASEEVRVNRTRVVETDLEASKGTPEI